MIILVSNTFATYKAQIRSSRSAGFKVLYSASCTSGADHAARAVVRKWYGEAAAETVAALKDPAAIREHIGDFNSDPKRKQVFEYFTFDDKAKASKAAKTATKPEPDPAKTITVSKPHALPPLKTIAADIEKATVSIQAAEQMLARATLADRIWLGVLCLAGKEHHALPASQRGQGRKGKEITSQVRTDLSAIHPQGFLAWLGEVDAGVSQPTLYRYMDAAKGIGLDAWSTEQEVRKLVAQRLQEFDARQIPLTLGMLAAQGKTTEPGETSKGKSSVQEIKTDTVQTLFTFMDEVVNVKDALTPIEHDAVVNRLAEILRRLTGKEWNPGA